MINVMNNIYELGVRRDKVHAAAHAWPSIESHTSTYVGWACSAGLNKRNGSINWTFPENQWKSLIFIENHRFSSILTKFSISGKLMIFFIILYYLLCKFHEIFAFLPLNYARIDEKNRPECTVRAMLRSS